MFKNASVYINGKKLGKATGGGYTPQSNSESVFGDGEYLGETKAPTFTEITVDTVEPVGSSGIDIVQMYLSREEVNVAIATIEGDLHQLDKTTITRCEVRWTNNNATKTGAYTFRGGKPKIV